MADVEALRVGVEMVELQNDRIEFAAVRARMGGEVLEEVGGSLSSEEILSRARLVNVALLVGEVVLTVVVGTARPTHVVPLLPLPAPPCEVGERLESATTTTFPMPC
jgi:hypothetical protein